MLGQAREALYFKLDLATLPRRYSLPGSSSGQIGRVDVTTQYKLCAHNNKAGGSSQCEIHRLNPISNANTLTVREARALLPTSVLGGVGCFAIPPGSFQLVPL